MKKQHIYNRILLPLALVLIVVLGFVSLGNFETQSLALEQEVRCGIEQHQHTQACYIENALICSKAVHVHTKNCYLILLKDNDINSLLNSIESQADNSLESLIGKTVNTALKYNTNLTSPMSTESITSSELATLNETIVEQDIQPQVILNENLQTSETSGDSLSTVLPQEEERVTLATPQNAVQSDTQLRADAPTNSGTGGASTYAVGDPTSNSNNRANYYVYLDNTWTSVGTLQFEVSQSGSGNSRRYTPRENTNEIINLYNNSLDSSITANEIQLKYATSANSGTWTNTSTSGNYTQFGSYNRNQQTTASQAKYVRLYDKSGNPIAFYTVTLNHLDGTQTQQYVRSGDTITLPDGYDWSSGDAQYSGGSVLEIYSTTTLTAQTADGRMRISYNVNFPTVSGVNVATAPTILGSTETRLTDVIEIDSSARVRNVSQQEVIGKVSGNGVGLSRVVRFSGWRIGNTDTIISANSTLTWAELQAYAGTGSNITLNGVWEYRAEQTASFYIRYDSVAVDTNGNITGQDSNLYTPELFATFVGGSDASSMSYGDLNTKYAIADTSSDNSYGADQNIRALYGQQADIWLQSFPRDEDIFELLKNYANSLQVDGDAVDVNDLNTNAYAIRWYVFKCQSDAWHIDGRLVKKEGYLDITKTFAGNLGAIASAKDSFYMTATNEDGDKSYQLYLEAPETSGPAGPAGPGATTTPSNVLTPSYIDGDTYTWEISGLEYGEIWTISEYTGDISDNVLVHSEYRVVDGYNTQNKSGTGPTVDISGMTYATDMGEIQALQVNFTNIYHTLNSIIIKKADSSTGNPLGGAVFSLSQNGELMRFNYDETTDRYNYDMSGEITELTGDGYYELVIDGFSYDNGNVEIMEIHAPEGYTPVESIQLGYLEDGTVGILNPSPMAEYYNGLLIVKNSTDSTSVTVNKNWLCPAEEWQPVTVQLLANGYPVNLLIPGVEPTVVLNADNSYSATWEELPLYANGQEIVWSVRETKIGNEDCLADFSFANWIVDYSTATYRYDDEGRLAETSFTISNDTRRTLLRVIKTNLGGGVRLEGAEFTLERLIDGEVDPTFITRTMTTGSDGTLTFDNLKYGDYRLTEIKPPADYQPMREPVYLTIHDTGQITVQGHPYAQAGSTAYSVLVINQPESPLPDTGGCGTGGYIALGLALMTMALGCALFQYRKRGGAPSG